MSTIEQKIKAKEERIQREKAQLKELQAKARSDARKRDTRKKVVCGYAFLKWLGDLKIEQQRSILSRVASHMSEKDRLAFPAQDILQELEETKRNGALSEKAQGSTGEPDTARDVQLHRSPDDLPPMDEFLMSPPPPNK